MTKLDVRRLDTRDADFDAQLRRLQQLPAGDRPRDRTRVPRRSSTTCACAATRRCSNTPRASTAWRPVGGRARAFARRTASGLRRDHAGATRSARSGRRRACARFHERQLDACCRSWSYRDADGTLLGQKVTPLDRVGIYVPGGKAAYPSSVLMNAIPARVAGVGEIVMAVPTPRGERTRWCLRRRTSPACSRVFTIGGAQAIAALAYGTAPMPHVDKIAGPGNAYVAEREAARVRRSRHRHDRRAERDPGAGRRQRRRPTGWRWTCSARPSTTSWRRASCCAPTPPTSMPCTRRSTACCRRCRARR